MSHPLSMDSALKLAQPNVGEFQDAAAGAAGTVSLDPLKLAQAQGLLAFNPPTQLTTVATLPLVVGTPPRAYDPTQAPTGVFGDRDKQQAVALQQTSAILQASAAAGDDGKLHKDGVDRSTPFLYSVRINPNNTRSYKRLPPLRGTYFDLAALRRDFVHCLHQDGMLPKNVGADDTRLTIGYIRPGHGARGQKIYLTDSKALSDMYITCRVRKEVMLWYGVSYDVNIPEGMYVPGAAGSKSLASQAKASAAGRSPAASGAVKRKKSAGGAGMSPAKIAQPVLPQSSGAQPNVASSVAPAVSGVESNLLLPTSMSVNWPSLAGALDVLAQQTQTPPAPNSSLSTTTSQPPLAVTSQSVSTPEVDPSAVTMRAQARTTLIDQLRTWFDLYKAGAVPQADFERHRTRILNDMTCL